MDVGEIITGSAAADQLEQELTELPFVEGSVSDSSPTTTEFDGNAGLSSTDDFYNGALLVFTSGALLGLARKVQDYTGSSRNLSLLSALPGAPANGDKFILLGRG